LAQNLKGGDWVALIGDMGTGKTVFTQGMAAVLGGVSPLSPTFSLVQFYPGRPWALRHVDLYRLEPKEVAELEWEELHDEQGVTVVEWAEKAQFLWPDSCVALRMTHRGGDKRRFEFLSRGARGQEIINKL